MVSKNILINALGVIDSGGITVLYKMLQECSVNKSTKFHIVCNQSNNIKKVTKKFEKFQNFEFKIIPSRGHLHRIYFENTVLRAYANENSDLVYNFSGSSQLGVKKKQIVKVHNLTFYSKNLDNLYKSRRQYISWIKDVYLRRLFFKFCLQNTKYIEIQSGHVKENLNYFVNIKNKHFYIKSDININKSEFSLPKKYDFSKKIKFLFIVGPHFEFLHKNLLDFTNAMIIFEKYQFDFEINITLSKAQLIKSKVWNETLSMKTNFHGYINDQRKIRDLFCDNTILVSTSVIETLGLHIIEGIKNGIITVVPDVKYANVVYGKNMFKYNLFDKYSLLNTIMSIVNYKGSYDKKILDLQNNLIQSESRKFRSILDIFDEVKNV